MHDSADDAPGEPGTEPITVPREPMPAAGSPFPVVASLAPVLGAVLIWTLTRSPFVLAFAALGPIIAIAGVVDSRWSSRRRLRADLAGYRADLGQLTAAIDEWHARERRHRRRDAATARRILDAGDDASVLRFRRWRMPPGRRTTVVVGFGDQPSSVRVDGAPGEEAARLRRRAAVVTDVPVEIDAGGGVGIVGPDLLTGALARGLLVQLCSAAGPDALVVSALPAGWSWAGALPHVRTGSASVAVRVVVAADASVPPGPAEAVEILLVLSERLDRIPTRCSSVIEFTGVSTARLHRTSAGRAEALPISVELVSEAEAARFAVDLAELARHAGVSAGDDALPTAVDLAALSGSALPPGRGSLSAVIGTTGQAPVLVDLVRDGPHAIVGGTTGSGKSELLVTWLTSLAERHPPEEVTMLLVDFKGGAAFTPLLVLPHVVGVVTDLDAVSAHRALESLRAEIRYRERTLRDAHVRDIAGVPSLARLVIVVDEFAAMLDGFPDLHALFVDVAARGRSLGMHLILCTQRPAGVVRDSLLANCGLRLSLRVHNRADSTAILGTDAAAFLPSTVPGRLVLAGASGSITLQVASADGPDLERAAGRWPPTAPVRRPWLDPLPARVDRSSLGTEPGGIRLALADHPAEQRQATAVWRPDRDGSLLVVGTARTGKTTLLDTIEAEAMSVGCLVERIGRDAELAWDVVHDQAASLARRAADDPDVLILLDDLDSLLAAIDPDDAADLRDGVLTLLRDGPRHAVRLVVTVQRLAGPTSALSGFVGSTVLLGTANRQEHVLAGGESSGWIESRRPGSAIWRGVEVQLCAPEPRAPVPRHAASRTVTSIDWHGSPLTLLVSGVPARRAGEIRARNAAEPARAPVRVAELAAASPARITVEQVRQQGEGPVVLVGDSDQWQAHWSLLTALREHGRIVVDGCTAVEFRAVTRIRARPPLLNRVPGRAWACEPGGGVVRVSLDPPQPDPRDRG